MAEERSFVREYQVVDLFDRTIAMVKRTWKTSLIIGGFLVLVPSALFGFALTRSVERIARMAMELEPALDLDSAGEWDIVLRMVGNMSAIWIVGLVAAILYALAFLSVTHAVRATVFGGHELPAESLGRALGKSLLPVVGQGVLKAVIFAVIAAVPSVFVVLAVGRSAGFFGVLAGITYVAGILAAIWIWVSLMFSSQAVVFDKAGVLGGLRESMRLVRGSWWRVFGIAILVQIILSFAVGIISTPIVGATVVPAAADIVRMSGSNAMSDAEAVEILTSFGGLGLATAVGMFLQQLLTLVFIPVFYGLFYVDLKVRSGGLRADAE